MTKHKQGGERREQRKESGQGGDMKKREYVGPDGEIHHHTKKYMEEHEGEQDIQQEEEE